jgi:hypothetical protein
LLDIGFTDTLTFAFETLSYKLYWVAVLATLSWAIFGRLKYREFASNNRLVLGIFACPLLVCSIPLIVLIFTVSSSVILMGLKWLYDPANLWISLPITSILWLHLRRFSNKYAKSAREAMKPWLAAMGGVAFIFLTARLWMPKTQWYWLFRLEWGASLIETYSKKIVPYPFLFNLLLLFVLFVINLYHPKSQSATQRIEVVIPWMKTFFSSLAVLTSVSFFGGGQAAILLESTAQEKFDRLKDQSVSAADLALAARLSVEQDKELLNVKEYLDSIYNASVVDIKNYNPLTDHPIPTYSYRTASTLPSGREGVKREAERNSRQLESFEALGEDLHRGLVRYMVENRVDELRKAMEHPAKASSAMVRVLPDTVKTMLRNQTFSEEVKKDAKDKFDKALDLFVDQASDLSAQPIATMLTEAGMPEFLRSIIKDLYNTEVLAMAKKVADPLADAYFKDNSFRS